MKKALYLIVLATLLSSCASLMSLAPDYGKKYIYKYSIVKPTESEVTSYSDSIIDVVFTISDKQIGLKLKNKSDLPIVLNWNNLSIVEFGEAKKVMHAGVKYAERNTEMSPTTIPPLASIDDMVLPSDNVYYREGYYGTYYSSAGGWETHDLFPTQDLNKPEIASTILAMKGQEFSLYMPLVVGKEDVNYNFVFKIDDVYTNTPADQIQSTNTIKDSVDNHRQR